MWPPSGRPVSTPKVMAFGSRSRTTAHFSRALKASFAAACFPGLSDHASRYPCMSDGRIAFTEIVPRQPGRHAKSNSRSQSTWVFTDSPLNFGDDTKSAHRFLNVCGFPFRENVIGDLRGFIFAAVPAMQPAVDGIPIPEGYPT